MIESAFIFSKDGEVIKYHLPHGRTAGSIPDTQDLWDVLWKHRGILGGVAHTHPWDGPGSPSHTDVTTFAAVEAALGQRLIWPVVTFTHVGHYVWAGPEKHRYAVPSTPLFTAQAQGYLHAGIERLRELSR